ncbi:MAG: multicopper oxidase domain-containing protein, partial [Methylocella sp.]
YTVTTENYNGAYLSPVIEALPGDTVAAHLENLLKLRTTDARLTMAGAPGENPTNLHYFHGGIVTPRNSRKEVGIDAGKGTGDNIYVRLKNQKAGGPYSFDFNVPIPGEGMLDARVLEGVGMIAHPYGLDWYHSHMHGISSDQVMGGLSGLLSVGEDNVNVKAKCLLGEPPDKCIKDTADLKKRTIVRYALLRDISLKNISALPGDDTEPKTAAWAPEQRDFPGDDLPLDTKCGVWKTPNSQPDFNPKLREGFCQRDQGSAWLFTLNGQRFPTITVEAGKNLLLRLGNLSANVAYWLELYNESTGETFPLTILSLDGVVPAFPVDPTHPGIPVDAFNVNDLLLMSASRAEIYVRNDDKKREEQVYVLRTKTLNTESQNDHWPEIQLARIVLKPSVSISGIALALNAPTESPSKLVAAKQLRAEPLPQGCVRDLDPAKGEIRRVTFMDNPDLPAGHWKIKTEIVHPPGPGPFTENQFVADPTATVDEPFEAYVQPDHSFDWEGTGVNHAKHVCIHLDHKGSHKQLWVLKNPTAELHNFHIHQIKFRLATTQDLKEHNITPPDESHTCPDAPASCDHPDYKYYEDSPNPKAVWHDTMPMPDGRVFVIMSFDAAQQVGRFVYHCHILKHEDKGLMAPIEVWGAP